MTVKGLSEYLEKRNVPYMGRKDSKEDNVPLFLNQLKGKKVAFETAWMIYKANWAATMRAIEGFSFIYMDGVGWTRPAIEEVLTLFKVFFKANVKKMLESGIKPVFIIEGKTPDMKQGTVQKRIETRTENESKADSISKDMDLKTFKKKLSYTYMPGRAHVEVVIEVLSELNLPVLRAKHEGEGVCAFLVNAPPDHPLHCACACTDDHDIFLYGTKAVIRDLKSINGKNAAEFGHFECVGYSFKDILYALDFLPTDEDGTPLPVSKEQTEIAANRFQLLCILCGTDYHDNVKGMGPAKIHKLMLTHDVYTYEDVCNIDSRFQEIPYHKIMNTIKENMEYSVIHLPPDMQ